MGTWWELHAWEPKVGMKIWYRRDIKSTAEREHRDMTVVAEILKIDPVTKELAILRDRGKGVHQTLKMTTWQRYWEPVPESKQGKSKDEERNSAVTVPNKKKQIFVTVEQESSHDEVGQESLRSGDELIDLHVDGSRSVLSEALRNLAKLVSATTGNPIVRARVMVLLDHPRKTN